MASSSKGSAAASVQYAQSGPIGMPSGSGDLPTGDSARVSTHWMPSVVHSSVQPASTCGPSLAIHRVMDGANAEHVKGADKLLKLTLDLGDSQRTIFSGIRSAYAPEQLVGRFTLVLANLKPRKMRFGTSEGMVLSAGPGGKEIFLLSPDSGATAGMKVT